MRDSRDRYANLDVNDLLRRIERHAGVAVLTTNARNDIDPDLLKPVNTVVAPR